MALSERFMRLHYGGLILACALSSGPVLAQDVPAGPTDEGQRGAETATVSGEGEATSPAGTDPQTSAASQDSMAQATTRESDMDDERARASFRLGSQYYEDGRFAEAAAEFERAFGLSGRTALLYNAYLAYRDAQDQENAARALRGFLANDEEIENRALLEARLAALEEQLASARERDAAAEASAAEIEEARRRADEAEERFAARSSGTRPWWPWVMTGAGAALVIVAIPLGAVAASDADALRADCNAGNGCNPVVNLDGRRSAIQGMAAASDALWVIGGVAAASGLVLALTLPDEHEDQAVSFVPEFGCTAAECRAVVRGRISW